MATRDHRLSFISSPLFSPLLPLYLVPGDKSAHWPILRNITRIFFFPTDRHNATFMLISFDLWTNVPIPKSHVKSHIPRPELSFSVLSPLRGTGLGT